ncbi:TPA: hypothetical protein ACU967_002251 [Burkholderia contaminans]|uniref:hypothetical protein n=1 Tax=Burkholderia contaminans TaxID=488447 RepID=UPI000CFEF5EA|nr:hypothetical protein [Burkholderia contaminans]HDR9065494.1 hypothetical protein [Burkholderia vietnamiensis]MBM6427933.1 hypothetical protein [Burkholderia contaminans]MCA7876764.1 hypothetical protein [Burkholderia contaminans]MDN8024213.1 hypothetical protein [Burkholderia contaminans]PRG12212.1 hypothetical protein C6Q17_14235 [Burkholderia contaminans]
MRKLECSASPDPVNRLVRALTAKEITVWLVEHHGLKPGARETVESNLREQFRWHRLQGRLDRGGWLSFIATLFGLRQSPLVLEKPETLWEQA